LADDLPSLPKVEKIRGLPGTPRATSACHGIPFLVTSCSDGHESWSLTLGEASRVRIFECRVSRRVSELRKRSYVLPIPFTFLQSIYP
jgi:hypothetical protein